MSSEMFRYGDPAEREYAETKGFFIRFSALNTGLSAEFKAFLTSYNDSFQSEWSSEQPFGRTDASRQFSHTMRRIDMSWSAVAFDENEALENVQKCTALTQMLYPVYEDRGGLQLSPTNKVVHPPHMGIAAPPLIMVELANLAKTITPNNVSVFSAAQDRLGNSTGQGLIACIESYTFTARVQEGFFDVLHDDMQKLLPKIIDLSCRFVVLHQVSPGIAMSGIDRETVASTYGDLYRVGYSTLSGDDSDASTADAKAALSLGAGARSLSGLFSSGIDADSAIVNAVAGAANRQDED